MSFPGRGKKGPEAGARRDVRTARPGGPRRNVATGNNGGPPGRGRVAGNNSRDGAPGNRTRTAGESRRFDRPGGGGQTGSDSTHGGDRRAFARDGVQPRRGSSPTDGPRGRTVQDPATSPSPRQRDGAGQESGNSRSGAPRSNGPMRGDRGFAAGQRDTNRREQRSSRPDRPRDSARGGESDPRMNGGGRRPAFPSAGARRDGGGSPARAGGEDRPERGSRRSSPPDVPAERGAPPARPPRLGQGRPPAVRRDAAATGRRGRPLEPRWKDYVETAQPPQRLAGERLQKLLAAAGVSSRRAAEQLITAGRVTVNGEVARGLGQHADLGKDDVRVDGERIRPLAKHTYLMMHKPRGYTSTVADPHAERTVLELLGGEQPRVYPAGRLDRESEGLLLLTDDGELTQHLLHPSSEVPREYAVLVRGRVTEAVLHQLRGGAVVEGKPAAPATVELGEPPAHLSEDEAVPRDSSNANPAVWLRFVLREGRKREIRVICERRRLQVERLVRVRLGPLSLGTLRLGKVRPLSDQEVIAVRRACGLDVATANEASAPEGPSQPPQPRGARTAAGRDGRPGANRVDGGVRNSSRPDRGPRPAPAGSSGRGGPASAATTKGSGGKGRQSPSNPPARGGVARSGPGGPSGRSGQRSGTPSPAPAGGRRPGSKERIGPPKGAGAARTVRRARVSRPPVDFKRH